MYKLSSLWLFVTAVLLLTSCGTLSEEVWINADGSGRYVMEYDASGMLGMMSLLDAQDEGDEGSESPEDFLKDALKQEKFDTTFSLLTMMPDSIKEIINDRRSIRTALESQGRKVTESTIDSVQNAFVALEDMDMTIKLDKAEEVLDFVMSLDFDSIEEMQNTFGGMDAFKALTPSPDAVASTNSSSNITSYKLTKGHLSIQQAISPLIKEMINNGGDMGDGSSESIDNIQMLEMMGFGKHDIVVHLPGIVKSVKGAEYREIDENTIALSIDYIKMVKDNALFKAEIDFKPKKKYRVVLDKKAMK